MGIVSIPAYAYFGTVNRQIDVQIHEDSNITRYYRSKYGNDAFNVTILDSTGIEETDLLAYLNLMIKPDLITQNQYPIFARNLNFYANRGTDSSINPQIEQMAGLTGFQHTFININRAVSKVVTLNNFELSLNYGAHVMGSLYSINGIYTNLCCGNGNSSDTYMEINTGAKVINIQYVIWPDNMFTPDGIRSDVPLDEQSVAFRIYAEFNDDLNKITHIYVSISTGLYNNELKLKNVFTRDGVEFSTTNSGINEHDTQNPYAYDGVSGMGGGDGKYNLDSDGTTGVPDLPDISAADLGFVTIYNPTRSQLKDLANFMWSNAFDLNTYKKLFADPMESIIGLAIVPVAPDTGGSKNVMFGAIDSGVNMNYVTSQYKKVDCGSVDIDKYVGSFLDYDYTKISIYLPYIGFRPLDTDDVMGRTISVEYNVDVLTGACAAFISVSGRGVLYSFNGSCITNVPLTANNFSGAIQNAVSAIISGAGAIVGAASGSAPLTAMGVSGLLNSAANTALNSKPDIQRSGNLGGSAGILSVQKPFVVIQRPDVSVPGNMAGQIGQCSNITMNLSDCKGFTMVEYVHLHDIPATSEEIKEIEALLKEGVIL